MFIYLLQVDYVNAAALLNYYLLLTANPASVSPALISEITYGLKSVLKYAVLNNKVSYVY